MNRKASRTGDVGSRVRVFGSTLTVLIMAALMGGCASMSLSRQDVVRQYDSVAQLSDGLENSRGQDGTLLAPKQFAGTKEHLDHAFDYARQADKQGVHEATKQGMASLQKLNTSIASNRQEMGDVLSIRIRANMQGANVLFKEKSGEADAAFRSASRMLEEGKTESARKERPELIKMYAQLELQALKKGTVAAAKQAIAAAEEAGADRHAPKTLQHAREELKLALSILDADRTRKEEGDAHALQAAWLANRANEISGLISYFKSQDITDEGRILWYQSQLQRVRNSLRNETLPFDQSNTHVIQALRGDALALKSVMEDMRVTHQLTQQWASQLEQDIVSQRQAHEQELQAILKVHESQLAALNSGNSTRLKQAQKDAANQVAGLKQRLSEQSLAQAQAQRLERRAEDRFKQTQLLFGTDEADVFRQGNNVLIRLKGFNFIPGKYDVEAVNYALLNKVVSAINTFPESTVMITGHTDALGSDSRNMELSAARAQSVVEFLSMVGGVKAGILSADGKGEEQPVESNETTAGRAANRRIDLLIVNN